ncbi:MAG: sulfatase, partial [Planctomycetota bacterium]
ELHQPLPAAQLTFVEYLKASGYYTASAGKWHLGASTKAKFDKVYTNGGPSGCDDWVRAVDERPAGKPFFLWLAAVDPHRGYKQDTIEKPHRTDDAVIPPYLPDTEATRNDFAMYYDEVSRLDSFVGRVVERVDRDAATKRNTLILFLSDNGRPFPRCKTTVYDSGIRTPFIVRWPSIVKANQVTESLVSSIDIGVTLCDLGGVAAPATFQGLSFAPVLRDPKAITHKYVFAEHNWHDYSAYKRAVRGPRYAYIWNGHPLVPGTPPADAVRSPTYVEMKRLRKAGKLDGHQFDCFIRPRPIEELYDVEKDPHQLTNLVHRSEHAAKLRELRIELAKWKHRTSDVERGKLRGDGFDRETGKRLKKKQ